MSEVERPSNDQSLDPVDVSPANKPSAANSIEVEKTSPSIAQPANPFDQDGWETVNLPGATPLQEISTDQSFTQASGQTYSDIEDAAVADLIPVLTQLQRENQELRDRITQFQQDLNQEQIERQLMQSHMTEQERQAEDTAALKTKLTTLQEQLSHQTHELELAQQASQRQEILLDTLTKQLESSQERNAQLERECAVAQQRYNEQVQQLLQSENQCRDLRTRLHRQQQQTLQFKVALEKSLEMAASGNPLPELETQAIEANPDQGMEEQRVNRLTELINLQNQPVQPWSAINGENGNRAPAVNPLSKLLNGNDTPIDLPDLDQMAAPDPSQEALEAVVDNPIFDLEPFIKAGAVNSAIVSDLTQAEKTEAEQLIETTAVKSDVQPIEDNLDDDPLWQDLARLINAVETSIDGVREQAGVSLSEPDKASTEVAAAQLLAASQTDEVNSEETAELPAGTTAWPAPVVYPTRSSKKLSSLAAVDLPMFPRPQNAGAPSNA